MMIKKVSSAQQHEHTAPGDNGLITYHTAAKKPFGERLIRNTAIAGLLIITIASLRNQTLPDGETLLTAVQGIVQQDWSDDIGKISFVSALFPETTAVFFSSPSAATLSLPCSGAIDHAWSQSEPYLTFAASDRRVYAVASGEVVHIGHGNDEEIILRLRHNNGLESTYYHLSDVQFQIGDDVPMGSLLGSCPAGAQPLIMVSDRGIPIDPSPLFQQNQGG